MSLDTLANVKTRLGITTSGDDGLLALLQNSADKWLTNYLDRDFGGGSDAVSARLRARADDCGFAGETVTLSRWPHPSH